jgi:ArsR family transcriptional regulator
MAQHKEIFGRLLASGLCNGENAEDHIKELRKLASTASNPAEAKRRAKVLKALGDENRQRIIGLLGVREMCVCEIMAALEMTQPTTSHHLKILEEAGVVVSRREGKWVFYGLRDAGLLEKVSVLAP